MRAEVELVNLATALRYSRTRLTDLVRFQRPCLSGLDYFILIMAMYIVSEGIFYFPLLGTERLIQQEDCSWRILAHMYSYT